MNKPIHQQLRAIRRDLGLTQYELAPLIGTTQCNLSTYERGRNSPSIPGTGTWARALGHRPVITRNGVIVGDLLTLYPGLPDYRKTLGVSQQQVARRMFTTRSVVANLEGRIRSGTAVRLATVVPYVAGLGCLVELAPAAAERAA